MKKSFCVLGVFAAISSGEEINLQDVNIDANATNKSASSGVTYGKFLGSSTYDRRYLDSIANGVGNFSNVIKKNVNTRASRGEMTSKNGGEITPQNISINGASFYQNNFMLDGVNINNDINPTGGVLTVGTAANITPFLNNASQGLNIDTDILESINIQDSSVSAKYGNFQGGVINAKTRDPKVDFGGKISFGYTSDRLQKAHIADEELDDYEYSETPKFQPDFKKYKTGLILEGYLSENFGLIFNYNQLYSQILQQMYKKDFIDESKVGQKRKLFRKNENLFLKGIWFANDNLTIRPSLMYAPYESSYYSIGGENARANVKGGGLTGSLELEYDFKFANLKQNLSFTTNKMQRESNTDAMLLWEKSKNNLGYTSNKSKTVLDGIGGDVKQEQDKFSYSADLEFKEFDLGFSNHKVIAGFGFDKTQAVYDVTKPYYRAISVKDLGTHKCKDGDIFCSTEVPFRFPNYTGQYFDTHYRYAGKTKVDMKSFSAYLEDEIKIDRFSIRPGVRLDKNDYMGKLNIAPRLNANLDLFNDDMTNIFGGYNRYYGRSIFAYKLRDGMASLMSEYTRKDPQSEWVYKKTNPNEYNFSELKVPYDDEYSFGWSQKFGSIEMSAKYLKREGKNLIRKSRSDYMGLDSGDGSKLARNYSLYTNSGKSKSDIYTLRVRSLEDIFILNTKNSFEISYNHTKTNRNFNSYENIFDDFYDRAKKVAFNGTIINESNLPKNNNDTPWIINANLATKFPAINLTWTNFFTLQGGYKGVVKHKDKVQINGVKYDNYESKKLGRSFVMDTKFTLDIPTVKGQAAYVSVDIYNVLNRKNSVSIDDKGVTSYDNGRQFWIEAGYKW